MKHFPTNAARLGGLAPIKGVEPGHRITQSLFTSFTLHMDMANPPQNLGVRSQPSLRIKTEVPARDEGHWVRLWTIRLR